MGGFILINKQEGVSAQKVQEDYCESLEVFKKKGLHLKRRIVKDTYILYVYNKYSFKQENILIFENDDFIVSTGTLFYRGETNINALKSLFNDFLEDKESVNLHLRGNFTVLLSIDKRLFCFNDFIGLYRIYCSKDLNIISSSFLAVSRAIPNKTIAKQELYEYLFHGTFYGKKTLFKDIMLLDSTYYWLLTPQKEKFKKNVTPFDNNDYDNFDDSVDNVIKNLTDYFSILKNNFQTITSALTGGYDSRLMYSLAKKLGITPDLHVSGPENSKDVKVAQYIAKNERIKIHHENREKTQKISKEEYPFIIEKNFYDLDGLGISGVFHNRIAINEKVKNSSKTQLFINGGGGEIYRDFWNLPNRKFIRVKDFLVSKYDISDYSICTNVFNKNQYFKNLQEKIKDELSLEQDILSRKQVQQLYPFFRLRYWQSATNSINNQFANYITPFCDPILVFESFTIPLKNKCLGRFEAALIKKTDKNVAKYMSGYGFDFYSNPKMKRKLKNILVRNFPIQLRPYVRKRRIYKKQSFPYYLKKEMLENIMDLDQPSIEKFINTEEILDPTMLSRALTIELLINDYF